MKARRSSSAWRLLRWPFGILLAALLVYQASLLAQVVWLRWNAPTSTAFMDAERERFKASKSGVTIRQVWVPYGAMSIYAKQAVIAAEDAGFSDHDGVDWEAIEKAARDNLRKGRVHRGGSTITMQLAKNLFLSADRSYIRKAQEFIITGMLEVVLDKRRILELYLNIAEWGVGVFGIEAASRHYFGVSASQLDPVQAAWLASILPAPKRYDRRRDSEWLSEKSLIVLERMPKVRVPR
jgi:monofunctional biosynthetic peptidoglycan transglycosylase